MKDTRSESSCLRTKTVRKTHKPSVALFTLR